MFLLGGEGGEFVDLVDENLFFWMVFLALEVFVGLEWFLSFFFDYVVSDFVALKILVVVWGIHFYFIMCGFLGENKYIFELIK